MVRLVVMPRPCGLAQCDLDVYQAYPPRPGAAVMVDGFDDEGGMDAGGSFDRAAQAGTQAAAP
ncbi:hypothetical protein ACZ91_04980 [Streptomyces regensis]|nr:hypothetical protein ACZ91_04980 [Streptomyces regensis]KOG74899.1 hypothetical protein ADK77_03635 [Streptomyces antibioticus]